MGDRGFVNPGGRGGGGGGRGGRGGFGPRGRGRGGGPPQQAGPAPPKEEAPPWVAADLARLVELHKKRLAPEDLSPHLRQLFAEWTEPLPSLLALLKWAPDLKKGRGDSQYPTIAKLVLADFALWWRAQPLERREAVAKGPLVEPAFHLVVANPSLAPGLESLLKLSEQPALLLPLLRGLIRRGSHATAVLDLAEKLHLQGQLDMGPEVLLPAALHNHRKLIKAYLERHPEDVAALAQSLDGALRVGFRDWPAFLRQHSVAPNALKYTVRDRLGKFLDELVGEGLVEEAAVPQLPHWRTEMQDQSKRGCLIYLAQLWYSGEISEVNFVDIVGHVLQACSPKVIWDFLVHLVSRRRDVEMAAAWCRRLNLHPNDTPQQVYDFLREHPTFAPPPPQDTPQLEGTLRLPACHRVAMVSSAEAVAYMESALRKLAEASEAGQPPLVGLDLEWVPVTFEYPPPKQTAALMQVCLNGAETLLVDLQPWTNRTPAEAFRSAFRALFGAAKLRKLGFDPGEDLSALRAAYPTCRDSVMEHENFVCVATLIQKLMTQSAEFVRVPEKEPKKAAPTKEPPKATAEEEDDDAASEKPKEASARSKVIPKVSLSVACETLLGAKLDKSERISHWGKRPLRPSQIAYAALDAYSLVKLYEAAEARAAELNLNFTNAVKLSTLMSD